MLSSLHPSKTNAPVFVEDIETVKKTAEALPYTAVIDGFDQLDLLPRCVDR